MTDISCAQSIWRIVVLTFTMKTVLLDVVIAGVCFIGDNAGYTRAIQKSLWLRAITDNMTHAAVAFFGWAAVTDFRFRKNILGCILCALSSSIVDMDHFLAAGSLDISVSIRFIQYIIQRERDVTHCVFFLVLSNRKCLRLS